MKQSGEKLMLNISEVCQGGRCGAESLQAEQRLVQKGVFMVLAIERVSYWSEWRGRQDTYRQVIFIMR